MNVEKEFVVTQETRTVNSLYHQRAELILEYDKIEWGEWWAEVYSHNDRVQVLHQHGGDDWLRMDRDEIPGLIALLVMIYTRSYK